jgi:hypothetical protein
MDLHGQHDRGLHGPEAESYVCDHVTFRLGTHGDAGQVIMTVYDVDGVAFSKNLGCSKDDPLEDAFEALQRACLCLEEEGWVFSELGLDTMLDLLQVWLEWGVSVEWQRWPTLVPYQGDPRWN